VEQEGEAFPAVVENLAQQKKKKKKQKSTSYGREGASRLERNCLVSLWSLSIQDDLLTGGGWVGAKGNELGNRSTVYIFK